MAASIVLGVLVQLLFLALIVGAVVWIVRASRRTDPEGERAGWSLRRLLQYVFLLAALFTAAVGLSRLLQSALPAGELLVGRDATELALGLSLSVVAIPVWLLLWRLASRHLRSDPEERGSAAWSLYLAVAATVSLIIAYVGLVQAGSWILGIDELRDDAIAAALVWAAVWGLHAWFLQHPGLAPTSGVADVVWLGGSAVGVVGLAAGAAGVLFYGFGQAYDVVAGGALVEPPATEALRRSLVIAVLAAPVWWWHWLRGAVRRPRTTLWHVYLMLLPVLGGLLTAVGSAAVLLHTVLQWVVGVPEAATAAAHFDTVPGALAGGMVGAWVWGYHRAILGSTAERERTEPERAYEYLVSAVGLGAAAAGMTVALVAAIRGVAPTPLAVADPGGRNTLVIAITLLIVGTPLWWAVWRRLQGRVGAGSPAELASPSRRAYLLLLFGATGLVAVISLVTILFVFFRDLLERSLTGSILYDLRVAIALVLTAGGVSAYHWTVHRDDRAARQPGKARPARSILLLSVDGRELGDAVARLTGASVRRLRRLDVAVGTADAEAVAAAVLASPHDRMLVMVDEEGTVRVIPYEPAD